MAEADWSKVITAVATAVGIGGVSVGGINYQERHAAEAHMIEQAKEKDSLLLRCIDESKALRAGKNDLIEEQRVRARECEKALTAAAVELTKCYER